MMLFASFVLPLASGFLLTLIAWPYKKPFISYLSLKLSIATGMGLGISSFFLFAWLALGGYRLGFISLVITELIVITILTGLLLWGLKRETQITPPASDTPCIFTGIVYYSLVTAFLCAMALTIFSFLFKSACEPHGGWDAWAIWNMRARFIFRGMENWEDAFTPIIGWTHPDYPLLLPGIVTRCWAYAGRCLTAAPVMVAMLLTFGAVVLLKTTLSALRGKEQGMLGALVLIGTPSFILHGASQYADIPLSFFILATIAILYLADRMADNGHGLLALAGLTAACAGWTKNEGLLFLTAVFIVRFIAVALWRGFRISMRQMAFLFLGALPALLIIVYFKLFIAPPNDIVLAQTSGNVAAKLSDISRYFIIGSEFFNGFMRLGFPFTGTLTILFAYLLIAGISIEKDIRISIVVSIGTIALMLAGYFFIFLISPYELQWQIGTALDRLILQVWPVIIFTYFTIVTPPSQISSLRTVRQDEKKQTQHAEKRRK